MAVTVDGLPGRTAPDLVLETLARRIREGVATDTVTAGRQDVDPDRLR